MRTLQQKDVKEDITKLYEVAKNMRKERIAMTRATISFKYFINNMTIEKAFAANPDANRELFDGISSFQTHMAKYYQRQTDSDNLLVWFAEDYLDILKASETALGVRRGLLMEIDKNMEKAEYQDNVRNIYA